MSAVGASLPAQTPTGAAAGILKINTGSVTESTNCGVCLGTAGPSKPDLLHN